MNYILHDTSPAAIANAVEANTCAHYANFRHLPEAEISDSRLTPLCHRSPAGIF